VKRNLRRSALLKKEQRKKPRRSGNKRNMKLLRLHRLQLVLQRMDKLMAMKLAQRSPITRRLWKVLSRLKQNLLPSIV
jgi:hypothetical protein